jgi:hypothetical protein
MNAVRLDLRAPVEDGLLEPSLIETNAQAAEVCFDSNHRSPVHLTVLLDGAENGKYEVSWEALSDRQRRSHRNELNAAEYGGYGVALAVVRRVLNLRGYERADHLSGADYYAIPAGESDFEKAVRLEVHGTQTELMSTFNWRVREKTQQLRNGASNLPGIACVVGFRLTMVMLQAVQNA